jgi:cyclophilin family peptidyl-prolyl cis-trans isomerase
MSMLPGSTVRVCILCAAALVFGQAPLAVAQETPPKIDHSQHTMPAPMQNHSTHQAVTSTPTAPKKKKASASRQKSSGDQTQPPPGGAAQPSMPHAGHAGPGGSAAAMSGVLGPYGIGREASGTSWVPDTTPHSGIHKQIGEWSTMWHALVNFTYDQQGGPRGGNKTFASGMVMGMAQREIGENTFGLRAMLSPEPFMGASGYPLLLATGETADGRTHLVDRQHPHDLFMELAAIYSRRLSANSSFFLYAGLPGEPALGPPAFMHRISGMDIPEAPITHHWLDSTHITFGVLTAGLVVNNWKLEASGFRGREPDQYRYDIEAPKLDSYSARLSWNPIRELSMQVSWGRLHSPEQLAPDVDEERFTASMTYVQPFGRDNLWSSTLAWGRKMLRPGETLDGYLFETAVNFNKRYTIFARAERVAENELTEGLPLLDGRVFTVSKISIGGIYDFPVREQVKIGVGGLVSKYVLPGELKPLYSSDPTSYMLFARLKVM